MGKDIALIVWLARVTLCELHKPDSQCQSKSWFHTLPTNRKAMAGQRVDYLRNGEGMAFEEGCPLSGEWSRCGGGGVGKLATVEVCLGRPDKVAHHILRETHHF